MPTLLDPTAQNLLLGQQTYDNEYARRFSPTPPEVPGQPPPVVNLYGSTGGINPSSQQANAVVVDNSRPPAGAPDNPAFSKLMGMVPGGATPRGTSTWGVGTRPTYMDPASPQLQPNAWAMDAAAPGYAPPAPSTGMAWMTQPDTATASRARPAAATGGANPAYSMGAFLTGNAPAGAAAYDLTQYRALQDADRKAQELARFYRPEQMPGEAANSQAYLDKLLTTPAPKNSFWKDGKLQINSSGTSNKPTTTRELATQYMLAQEQAAQPQILQGTTADGRTVDMLWNRKTGKSEIIPGAKPTNQPKPYIPPRPRIDPLLKSLDPDRYAQLVAQDNAWVQKYGIVADQAAAAPAGAPAAPAVNPLQAATPPVVAPVVVTTREEYDALPAGTRFSHNGRVGTKR